MADPTLSRPDQSELEELRRRLAEANEVLDAIRNGEVDALVIRRESRNQVFSLDGAERPYRLFVEEMQQGAATLGPGGRVLYCNLSFARMLQESPGQVPGRPFDGFITPAALPAWQALLRRADRGRAAGELELRRRDGSALPAFATVHGIATPAGTSLCVVLADLTEQKHFERLARAEQELKEAMAAAEAAGHAKDRFLAVLGHELRNPLGPIRNSVAIMQRVGSSDPVIRQAGAMIDRQVTHMTRLIDDLLDVSRIANGKITLRPEALDLAELLRAVVADQRPLLEANRVELAFNAPPAPVRARGDGVRIAQVVSNLLINAGKFTNPGGRVTLALDPDADGNAVIQVADTGVGMDPETQAHLFEPFMQAGDASYRERGGLGLGLALAQGLVRLHGGRISAQSAGPGQGSRFTVVLPILAEPPGEAAPAGPRAELPAARSPRVLIVEDNLDAAEALRMLLDLYGYTVAAAHAGAEGLALARTHRPDIVLCDIGLPGGMDGYAVAAALRADPQLASAHLVAMTGFGQDEDRRRALEAGFDDHLTKPADPDALLRLLAQIGARPAGPES